MALEKRYTYISVENIYISYHEKKISVNHQQKHQEMWYGQTSNIRHILGYKIVDHSEVVGALPIGAAPTTSSFST